MILDSPYISGSIVIENSLTASNAVFSGNLNITGDITSTEGFTGSLEGTASIALNAISSSHALNADNAVSSSFAATSSFADSFTVAGEIVAQTLNVQQVTSSVVYSSGSNVFGNSVSNTQQFTGSLQVSGSTHYLLGNVGIGTDSPSQKLHVNAGHVAVSAGYGLVWSGDADRIITPEDNVEGGLFKVASGAATRFLRASTESMRINGNGYVGIGIDSPAAVLHVQTGSADEVTSFKVQTSGNVVIERNHALNPYIQTTFPSGVPNLSLTNDNGTLVNISGGSSYFLGDVGIGTNSPGQRLDISGGKLKITLSSPDPFNTVQETLILSNGAGNGGAGSRISFQTGNATSYIQSLIDGANSDAGSALVFATPASGTTGTERVRIASGGNVGIGTISPSQKLEVAGNLKLTGTQLYMGATASGDSVITIYSENSSYSEIRSNAGFNSTYNGIMIASNYNNANSLPAWSIDLGGCLNSTSNVNAYTLGYKSSGGSWASYMLVNSSGNVGIGTTSPAEKLHVVGNILVTGTSPVFSGGALEIQGTANAVKTFYLNRYGVTSGSQHRIRAENSYLEIASANSEPIVLSGGNVGIGTTSPSAKLHVEGSQILNGQLVITTDSGNEQAVIRRASNTNEQLIFGFHSGDYAQIQAVEQTVAYRTLALNPNGGNVGIGTTSPSYKLEVVGTGKISGAVTTSTSYNIDSGLSLLGNHISTQWYDGDDTVFANYRGYNWGTTQFRNFHVYDGKESIVAAFNGSSKYSLFYGNVGIGTTSPGQKLHVAGNIYATGYIQGGIATTSAYGGYAMFGSNSSATPIAFGLDGTQYNMVINTSGNVGIGTTSPADKLQVNGNVRIANGGRLYMNNLLPLGIVFQNSQLADGDGSNATVSDSQATNGDAKRRLSGAAGGTFFYGPYTTIPAGDYTAYFRLKVDDNSSGTQILTLDITNVVSGGSVAVYPNSFTASDRYQYFKITFTVTNPAASIEFRGLSFTSGITNIYLDHIMILPGN